MQNNNNNNQVIIPTDVPESKKNIFNENYTAITYTNGRLLLFAGDHKLEHLYTDFYGPTIPPEVALPEHLFSIANQGFCGAFATHLGLITRYGKSYTNINYIVKINGKTNLVSTEYQEPFSRQLWSINQIIQVKEQSGLKIRAIGYTIYLGSKFEAEMLEQAAQAIYQAHQAGLVTILWIYPRGQYVTDELAGQAIIGAAGVANCLGADFVKINPPRATKKRSSEQFLAIAAQAAGNTKIICAGGCKKGQEDFLHQLYNQLHTGNTWGSAIGRNIYQQSLSDAIAYTKIIYALIAENKTVAQALSKK